MQREFRVGVVGSTGRGNYGHGLDTAWQAVPATRVVAVADDNKTGLAAAAQRLKVEAAFADYREMLDRVRPDICAIAPRWVDQHYDMAMEAARRGIHVYMEKPFCRTLDEADGVVAACEAHGVKLAVAHPTRYSPLLETIRRLIEAGEIGEVLEYRARGKEDRRGGGEDLWVLGTHVLDMIHALAGRPVRCQAWVRRNDQPISAADVQEGPEGLGPLAGEQVHAVYDMPDGSTAFFASHRHAGTRPSRYGLQIFGSGGVIELLEGTLPDVWILRDGSWSPARSGASWERVSSAGIGLPEPLTDARYRQRHTLAIVDLLEAIEVDRLPRGNMYAARDVCEMIAAVFESQRQRQVVSLPLATRCNPLRLLI